MSAALPRQPGRLRSLGLGPGTVLTLLLLSLGGMLGLLDLVLSVFHITDGVLETKNGSTVLALMLVFLLAVLLSAWYRHRREALLQAVAERFGVAMRVRAMQAAIRRAARTDSAAGLGALRDIAAVQRLITGEAVSGLLDLVGAAAALALVFHLNDGFGWILTGGMAATGLLAWLMGRVVGPAAAEAEAAIGAGADALSGRLLHADVVRGLGQMPAILTRWQRRHETALGLAEAAEARGDALRELQGVVALLTGFGILGTGILLVIEGRGTIGLVLAALLLARFALAPCAILIRHWRGWQAGLRAWARLRRVLEEDGEVAPKPVVADAPAGLVVEGLGFQPPGRERPVIAGLGFALPPGSVLLIEGANGTGKTTLLRLILGLLPPGSGRVLLDGQDTWFCDRGTLGARIGYLPQDIQLLEADIVTNIGRGPGAPPELVVAAARAAGAHDMIGRQPMGYQTPAGSSAGLSAGQRRLVALARALYGNPRLLVLDEPEIGLDGAARQAMRAAVEHARLNGAVVLVVTHEPATWADLADRRLRLGEGGAWEWDADGPGPSGHGQELHLAAAG
ncbi:ATP-binding cassette domain-containing protein [Belnapia rosea]|uniref:ATP-binding cassette domain-containing protein n=1 Tax=Belnapia rosea TaxID=938405 RepID=UPI00087F6468|nr:ATP-binding cassette domain-containing protein [Belnapia rosea]SDB73607.1 ATP-binding cassette, subfamily C [Belnapia rosea]